jgi:hypothetical protein
MPEQNSEVNTNSVHNVWVLKKIHLGRPPAKRSDPDYTQVSGYIRRSTFIATKRKLLDDGDREFSELLEELLVRWLGEA